MLLRLLSLTILLVSVSASAQERPASRSLTQAQLDSLAGGDVIAEVERDGNNNRAELVCAIDGDPEVVFDVIVDYGAYETWFPDQVEAEVREDFGDSARLYGETRVPVLRNRRYEFVDSRDVRVVDGETHYIDTWEYVEDSGNLNSTTGFWYVQPMPGHPDKTLVRMVVHADIGMWLPQAIINWGTRRMMPGIAEGLQEQCDDR